MQAYEHAHEDEVTQHINGKHKFDSHKQGQLLLEAPQIA
jgi:hypothetical protein